MDRGRQATDYGAAALDLGLTRRLAEFLARTRYEDLPEAVHRAARRGLLDWMGCALAGSVHPSVDIVSRTLCGSSGSSGVIGRTSNLAMSEAALINGQMGHVLDFDDTHMGGVILHASSPILAALLALAGKRQISGRELILAYTLGFDAGVRTGQAAPLHHAGGWHLTGTLGTIAAGVSVASVLGLDAPRMANAIALAATQASGMQQNRGTMTKSLHAGKAAANGLLAGLLAENGFDGSDESLEGRRGFCRIYSAETREDALLDELGTRWEILHNGHKPYACGVVLHPAIDAMIALGREVETPERVRSVNLRVNPLAVTVTGVVNPRSGLKSKFSLAHTAAVSFIDRAAGVAQFSDAQVGRPDVAAFAEIIHISTDEALDRDQAEATVALDTGETKNHRVANASGTIGNPMSDEALIGKFLANAVPIIGSERAHALHKAIWDLDALDHVGNLVRGAMQVESSR